LAIGGTVFELIDYNSKTDLADVCFKGAVLLRFDAWQNSPGFTTPVIQYTDLIKEGIMSTDHINSISFKADEINIASFNARAINLCVKSGFQIETEVTHLRSQNKFTIVKHETLF